MNQGVMAAEAVVTTFPASKPLRLLLATDAWAPQVSGYARSLGMVASLLRAQGDAVEVIEPLQFRSFPLPTYPDIPLALAGRRALAARADAFQPNAIFVASEGPIGWAMRSLCRRRGWPFISSFHTKFPDYIQARTGIPAGISWRIMRRFHEAAGGTFAATPSLRRELTARGFTKVKPWTRGVDTALFRPRPGASWDLPRPVFLFVGRVAVEKNLEAFLGLDLPGSKVVVGEGPQRAALEARFPHAHFAGLRRGEALAEAYAAADVFVFPSRTDTFGLVLLEALASGTPVAAYPVTGPVDVVTDPAAGVLAEDLGAAALAALHCDRAAARAHAERFSWAACAATFRQQMLPLG